MIPMMTLTTKKDDDKNSVPRIHNREFEDNRSDNDDDTQNNYKYVLIDQDRNKHNTDLVDITDLLTQVPYCNKICHNKPVHKNKCCIKLFVLLKKKV